MPAGTILMKRLLAPLLLTAAFAAIGCGSGASKPRTRAAPRPEHAYEEAVRRANQAQLPTPKERAAGPKIVQVKLGEFKAKFVKKPQGKQK
jgi:hypothetical protein